MRRRGQAEQHAVWLLAQMLEWHRRGEKSVWWEYFRLCALCDEELQEDESALGGLTLVGEVGRIKRSIIYRYSFPPQDHAIDRALEVRDPRTGKNAGEVVGIDERNRTIDLKRGASSSTPHPTALIPFDIVNSTVLSGSIFHVATWIANHGITGSGRFQSARGTTASPTPIRFAGSRRDFDRGGWATDASREGDGAVASPPGFRASDPRASGVRQNFHRSSHDCRPCEAGSARRDNCW